MCLWDILKIQRSTTCIYRVKTRKIFKVRYSILFSGTRNDMNLHKRPQIAKDSLPIASDAIQSGRFISTARFVILVDGKVRFIFKEFGRCKKCWEKSI